MAGKNGGVDVPISSTWNPRGIRQAKNDLSAFDRQAQGFSKSITKTFTGMGAAIGASFALGSVVDQIGQAVTAASDLAESQSKVNVVFGQSAKAINEWADTSATSMLMSKQAALEAAGTYGNLFQAFGIGQGKAQEMSTTLVALSADLASFNNTSVDDAIQALRSGLSGETEPLKRYGVALTDVRLRQQAMSMGIYDGVGVLNAAQKAQASYALILEDTALAQGDVKRTASGYANTLRAVQAAVSNAQAEIGGEFLSSIQAVSTELGGPDGLVGIIDNLGQEIADNVGVLGAFAEGLVIINNRARDLEDIRLPEWLVGSDGSIDLFSNSVDWSWLGVGFSSAMNSVDLIKDYNAATDATKEAQRALYDGYVRMAPVVDSVAEAAANEADAMERVRLATFKVRSEVDQLRTSFDKLNGRNLSRIEDQIALSRTKSGGPDASKQREVTTVGKDGKPVKKMVDVVTAQDAKLWATQVARDTIDYADDFKGPKATKIIERNRKFLENQLGKYGVKNPVAFANSILGTPDMPVTRNQQIEGKRFAGMAQTTNYHFYGGINVDSSAAAQQAAKEARRLAALSGDRYAGMAETGKGYQR